MKTRNIFLASVIAAVIVTVSLMASNSEKLPSGQASDKLVTSLFYMRGVRPLAWQHDSIPATLMVDISNDRHMVTNELEQRAQVDRKLLLHLLQKLQERDVYRYVMLDVMFDSSFCTEYDSALFCTINSMRDIVVAANTDTGEAVAAIKSREAPACYSNSSRHPQFLKYPLIVNKQKSMPVRMYEELGHTTLRTNSILSRSYPVVPMQAQPDTLREMGRDLLDDTLEWCNERGEGWLEEFNLDRGKIVLIGDFGDDGNDMHYTYAGKQHGCLINYNAYLTLLNGHHNVNLWALLLMFALTALLCYYYLIDLKPKNTGGYIIKRLLGYLAPPWLIAAVVYSLWGEMCDMLVMTILLAVTKLIIDTIHFHQSNKIQTT